MFNKRWDDLSNHSIYKLFITQRNTSLTILSSHSYSKKSQCHLKDLECWTLHSPQTRKGNSPSLLLSTSPNKIVSCASSVKYSGEVSKEPTTSKRPIWILYPFFVHDHHQSCKVSTYGLVRWTYPKHRGCYGRQWTPSIISQEVTSKNKNKRTFLSRKLTVKRSKL